MSRDCSDMLSALCAEGLEFLVVGARALAFHGHPRAKGYLDILLPVPMRGRAALIADKRAVGRARDLAEIEALESDPRSS